MSRRRRRKREKRRQQERAAPAAAPAAATEPPATRHWLGPRLEGLVRRRWVAPAALVVLTLAVYARSMSYPFIYRDDSYYICEDVRIQELSLRNAWMILTTTFLSNYHPVTTFTFAFDRAAWGDWLPGFRMTQLAFYAGGVVLLYFLFQTILASRAAAFAAAAIYAAHTIHVESVAWLASRKDVACLVFYAGAILAYVRYARRCEHEERTPLGIYLASVALAAAAMLSKGYAVVLPVVLVAYDACFGKRPVMSRRRVLDKIPFVMLAVLTAVLTYLAQGEHSTLIHPDITLWQRLALLCKVFAAYVGRTILPVWLCAMYVVDQAWLHPFAALLGALLGAGAVAAFFALRRKLPAAAFGIALFVLPLGTVMNTFFTLRTWMTDRYLFFPTIGSTLALAAGGLWLYRNGDLLPGRRRWAVPAAATAAVALYAALTVARIGVWESGIAFWSDVLRKQNDIEGSGPVTASDLRGRKLKAVKPRLSLAIAYDMAGRADEAEALTGPDWLGEVKYAGTSSWYVAVLRFQEDGDADRLIRELQPVAEAGEQVASTVYTHIGTAYEKKGDLDAARDAYLKAVELCQKHHRSADRPMLQLGLMELTAGRLEKAADWFRRARAEGASDDPRPVYHLGLALEDMGRVEEAWRSYEEALRLEPRSGAAHSSVFTKLHMRMGGAAVKLGRRVEESLRRAEDSQERVEAHLRLGRLEYDAGHLEEAAEWFRRARKDAASNDPRPAFHLGRALADMGRVEEAYRVYGEALEAEGRTAPDLPAVPFSFARVHMRMGEAAAKLGREEEARRHFQDCVQGAGDNPLDVSRKVEAMLKLGRLEFGAGEAERAAEWFRRAREEAPSGDPRPAFYLALSLEKTGQTEAAWALYEEVLTLKGRTPPGVSFNFAGLHQQMGKVSEERGRTEEAVGHYAELLRLVPDHPDRTNLRLKMGIMEEKLGHAEKAVEHLKEVVRLSPDGAQRANVGLKMALLEEGLGRKEEAIRHFEEALRLVPDHPNRDAILAKIEGLRGAAPAQ